MLIVVKKHYLYVANELPNFHRATASEIDDEFWNYITVYDESCKWELNVQNPPQFSKFRRFLTKVCWDPEVQISARWEKGSSYNLEEISRKIKQMVSTDDDLIQQWVDKEDIYTLLKGADDYHKMVKVVEIICGAHEENRDLQKFLTDAIPDFFKEREE